MAGVATISLVYAFDIHFSPELHRSPIFKCNQARWEPQWGPAKHSHGAAVGRKFLNFFMQNDALCCVLYFWGMAWPPPIAGLGVTYPPPQPLPTLSAGLSVTQWILFSFWLSCFFVKWHKLMCFGIFTAFQLVDSSYEFLLLPTAYNRPFSANS